MSMAKTKSQKPPVAVDQTEQEQGIAVHHVTLNLPVIIPIVGYVSNRIARHDVRLSTSQSVILKQIENGLISEGATLENGKAVASGSDALKYILEVAAKRQAKNS